MNEWDYYVIFCVLWGVGVGFVWWGGGVMGMGWVMGWLGEVGVILEGWVGWVEGVVGVGLVGGVWVGGWGVGE